MIHVNQYKGGWLFGLKFQAVITPSNGMPMLNDIYIYARSWKKLRKKVRKYNVELPEAPTIWQAFSEHMWLVYAGEKTMQLWGLQNPTI